jgi:arylsulfatase A-like enzyme
MTASPGSSKTLLALLLVTFFSTGCSEPQPPFSAAPYNLVIVGIDTVGAEAFFSDRIDDALSPRLDDAQQYRNANSVAPWTIPAVASTLTGLYPVQHNAGQFLDQPANLDVDLPSALDESALTLADVLGEQRFRTSAFSAHYWIDRKFGLAQGFEQLYFGNSWKRVTAKFYRWLDEPEEVPAKGEPLRFFAYLHFMEAHDWHLEQPPSLQTRLADVDPALQALLREDSNRAACIDEDSDICLANQVYNLAVRELRVALAELLQNLEDRDLLESTLVLVYSDHGEEFWEHKEEHQQQLDPRGIYGFGHGQSLYQELLHVPLLLWHPEVEGSIRQDLVSLIDVMPSVLSWLEMDPPTEPLPGLQLPAGTDPPRSSTDPRLIYASGIAYGPEAVSVRQDQLKSIMRYPERWTMSR